MQHSDLFAVRKQLITFGYNILPNKGKIPAIKGWNTPDFVAHELTNGYRGQSIDERIEGWKDRFDAPSTGVRIENGLGVIDIDVDDPLVDRLLEEISIIAPQVGRCAPTRYGGGQHKMALFVQIAGEPFVRVASRRFNGHMVEIFGGGRLKNGNCSRQFGVYGPHSYDDAGQIKASYSWAEGVPQLSETKVKDLPAISRIQALDILNAFEELAQEAGWIPEIKPDVSKSGAVYDIDDASKFDTDKGGRGLTYEELSADCELYGDLRCASSFIDGRDGQNTSHCWVHYNRRHDCVAVHVFGDETTHYPKIYATSPIDDIGPVVAAAIEARGEGEPVFEPNWRERIGKGLKPAASLHNARLAIEASGLICSEDVFHNKMFIGRSDAASPRERLGSFIGEVTDGRILSLRRHLSDRYGFDLTEKHVRDAVLSLAGENAFDPVCDMLEEAEKGWDGVERLDRMAVDYFNCGDTELNRAFVRKTMLAAVWRARQPGCKVDTILVMESREGWNKSTSWRVLAGENNFSDASIIGHNGREVQEQLADVWIHENPDLAGMKKAEVEVVKAFASRQEDRSRPAYGRFLVSQSRHSIEVGTTNSRRYLQSQTGNRRFWPIEILKSIDLNKLKRDRLQLWGEAAALQSGGESLVLDQHLWRMAAVEQDERRVQDPWEVKLSEVARVPMSGPIAGAGYIGNGVVHVVGEEERIPTSVIFDHVLRIPGGQLQRHHSTRLAEVMRVLGWRDGQFKLDGVKMRGYVRGKNR